MKNRRLGRFKVTGSFLKGAMDGEGENIFTGMIILDLRRDWILDLTEYVAWNSQFDQVEEGSLIPEYEATIYSPAGVPRWTKVSEKMFKLGLAGVG